MGQIGRIAVSQFVRYLLTHWGRDKMGAIFQTTSSSGFSWIKMYVFRLTFHWNLFLVVQLTIFQHRFRWWLGADQATSHYLKQWWLDYRRIYASLGLNDNIVISVHIMCVVLIRFHLLPIRLLILLVVPNKSCLGYTKYAPDNYQLW